MAKREKSNAQILVPDGAGGVTAVEDRRFEKGWPIEVPVAAEDSDRWLQYLEFECEAQGWPCHSLAQQGREENSGSVTIRTLRGERSPELVIRWERRRGQPLKARARLGGTPELTRGEAEGFFAAVKERCRTQPQQRLHCSGQLHYHGLPWRGELWLEETLRLGPPSRDGGMSLHGFRLAHGPQVILVDAQVDALDAQAALSAFDGLLRELAVFLSVVMRTPVSVPHGSPPAWTWTRGADGRVECDVRFLGYLEQTPSRGMPAKGQVPPIRLKPVRRPDLSLPGVGDIGEAEQWLPEDVLELWKQVTSLPGDRRQQFCRAGYQWRLALSFAHESPTDSHAKMVVACESLKPAGEAYDHHNVYDVVEALWGKGFADALRGHAVAPQDLRNGYFHRGELCGEEMSRHPVRTTFHDPSFRLAHLTFRCVPPAAILDWLRLGGSVPLPPKRASWRKRGGLGPVAAALLVLGWPVCLLLGWLLRWWWM